MGPHESGPAEISQDAAGGLIRSVERNLPRAARLSALRAEAGSDASLRTFLNNRARTGMESLAGYLAAARQA